MGAGSSRGAAAVYPTSRGKMLPQPYNGGTLYLTTHFKGDTCSLDLYSDTATGTPKPLPASAVTTGVVNISGSGVSKPLVFAPARGAGERPAGEAEDGPMCSHFVAAAPAITRESIVVITVTVDGAEVVFKNFIASLYAARDV